MITPQPISLLNVGLMIHDTPNGFQIPMRQIAGNGYWELKSSQQDFNYHLKKLVKDHKPDITFIQLQAEGILDPQTAYDISRNTFVINWTGDIRATVPAWMLGVGRNIQLTAFSNMPDVDTCNQMRIKADYLDIGINPEIYKHRPLNKEYEIVAMFNDYGPQFPLSHFRRKVVHEMKAAFGDRFKVFGIGWGNVASGNLNGSQEDESIAYNKSKIALNISHFNYHRYSSDRLLRILGSHTFCLSHNFSGIELDYKIGEHLDVFGDIPDLIQKCHLYLADNEARDRIAMAGGKHCHEQKTFSNMAQNIVNLYLKHKK